jgi:FlaG/FlaF family flagellin (archaellin)
VASVKNFEVDQGATFSFQIEYLDSNDSPINLTGSTAKMQVRDTKGGKQLVATLSTPSSNGINIDGNMITVTMPAASTNKLIFPKSAYDIVVTDTNGNKIRILEGFLTLSRSVTI